MESAVLNGELTAGKEAGALHVLGMLEVPSLWEHNLLAAGAISTRQMALLAVIAVSVVFMMMTTARRRREVGSSPKTYLREERQHRKKEQALHSDIGEIMMHLQQVAREINAQLDAKYLRLEQVIEEADARISQLESRDVRSGRKLSRDVSGAGTSDAGQSAGSGSKRVLADGALNAHDRERIGAMAAEGKTVIDIARALNRRVGEVALILALGDHAGVSLESAMS